MSLHGHVILIIEPEPMFALDLQASIERDSGESIACADVPAAVARCAKFKFTAAIVNTLQRAVIRKLLMPVVLYHGQEGDSVVLSRLKMLLAATRLN
jgi:hypothetical protein